MATLEEMVQLNERLNAQLQEVTNRLEAVEITRRPPLATERDRYGRTLALDKLLARPEKFGATEKEDVINWLHQVETYFEALGATTEERLKLAPTFFKEDASQWWRTYQEEVQRGEKDAITNWPAFVVLAKRWAICDDANQARQDILTVRQGGRPVRAYNLNFQRIAGRLPKMDKEDKMEFYRRGLDRILILELGGESKANLDELMLFAETKEMNLRRAAAATRTDPWPREERRGWWSSARGGGRRINAMCGDDPDGALLASEVKEEDYELFLNFMRNRRPGFGVRTEKFGKRDYGDRPPAVTPGWVQQLPSHKQQWFAEGKCIECGSLGHVQRDCIKTKLRVNAVNAGTGSGSLAEN
ncbi:MAG: retrotransposon gag family protein [Gaiellaceae bacterium]